MAASASSSRPLRPGRAFARPSNWKKGHQLQPDPAVRIQPGRRLCRCGCIPDITLRGADSRLVQGHTQLEIRNPRTTPGYSRSPGFITTTSSTATRRWSWVPAFATPGRLRHWRCDRLTISPALLTELAADEGALPRQLDPARASSQEAWANVTEAGFRYELNADAMATEKLAEGFDFVADQIKLSNSSAHDDQRVSETV